MQAPKSGGRDLDNGAFSQVRKTAMLPPLLNLRILRLRSYAEGVMRRREFLVLLGGGAAWPLAAIAQQPRRNPRIGVLIGLTNDAESQARTAAFEKGLSELGWTVGGNLQIQYRYAEGDAGRMRALAKELVDVQPDVILGHSTPVVKALFETTRTIPIVFVVVSDPVGSGFVTSMARPGGNVTGFTNLESSISGKYLQMLREITTEMTPPVTRVALMFNPTSATSAGTFYLGPFMTSAKSFSIEPRTAHVKDAAEIERTMAELGREPGCGLVVMPDNFMTLHRELIISLAARYRLPAVYPYRYFVEAGGLLSYGVDVIDIFRRASSYVNRILKGEKSGELPVQAPTRFELAINLKTAKTLGLAVPRILLGGADVLIQ
jgi:putative tryptophan/tyrosine transport system substrate-binding protein